MKLNLAKWNVSWKGDARKLLLMLRDTLAKWSNAI